MSAACRREAIKSPVDMHLNRSLKQSQARVQARFGSVHLRALAVLVSLYGLCCLATAQSADRAQELVSRLFVLADSGRLAESHFVAKSLGVKASFRYESVNGSRWDCTGAGIYRRRTKADWTPPWAKTQGSTASASGFDLPADALEWAASSVEYGLLKVSYEQLADVQCPAEHPLIGRAVATVLFTDVPAFACLPVGSDSRWGRYEFERPLPRPHGGPMTTVYYRVSAEYRVTILVEHWEGERCPRNVLIRQEPVGSSQ